MKSISYFMAGVNCGILLNIIFNLITHWEEI